MNNNNIEDKLKEHSERLDKHENEIGKLKLDDIELKTEMKNVCVKVSELIVSLRWEFGILITIVLGILAFFIKK